MLASQLVAVATAARQMISMMMVASWCSPCVSASDESPPFLGIFLGLAGLVPASSSSTTMAGAFGGNSGRGCGGRCASIFGVAIVPVGGVDVAGATASLVEVGRAIGGAMGCDWKVRHAKLGGGQSSA